VSDQSQGPGWWLASDGKWYPPEPPTPSLPPPPAAPASNIPASPQQGKPLTIPAREPLEWVSFLGAVALVLGSFMTWASAGIFKVAGTEGDGIFTIAFGVGAAILSWKRIWVWATVLAGLGLAVVVWKLIDIARVGDNEFLPVSPGIGLYVCGAGALAAIGPSVALWSQRKT
jgi:hypothetical protein